MKTDRRITELAEEIRVFTFQLLDGEFDVNGMEAGRVAAATESAFMVALADAEDIDLTL